MARVLITLPPLTGHLNPALALAEELTAKGHSVAWAAHTRKIGDKLPPRAIVFPLDHATPDDFDIAAPAARGIESVRLFFEDYTIPMARRLLQPLEAIARDFRPDVMAIDHQMPAGALVARKLGLPWASLVTTSASILKMSPTLDAWVAGQLLELQQGYLPPELIVERPDFSPHRVIVFSIEALIGNAHARVDANYAFVGPAQSQGQSQNWGQSGGHGRRSVEFPWQWLRSDRRRLLVSLGTVSRDRDTRFFEVIMTAVGTMPEVQAVLVAPAQLQAQAPDNVLVRDYVPQLELLDRVDGVICHAGHNTVCEALTRGLPLIVAPIRDDQPVIARQVIDAGAALFMRHGKVTPATAQSIIRTLLDTPALATRAQALGQLLREAPGVAAAAAMIDELTPRPAAARHRVH